MKFRNSKYGIIIRRNLSKWFFWPIYYFQKIYLNTKLFIYKDKPMIIILTIGKVASSSLYFTLKDNLNSNIFHLHFISNSGIKKSWISHLSSKRKSIPLHLINSKILEKKISKYKGHLNIITIFREPVERKISAFFQNIGQYYNQIDNKELKIEDKLNDNFFMEHFNEEDNWIYEELIKKFGFKVYKKRI